MLLPWCFVPAAAQALVNPRSRGHREDEGIALTSSPAVLLHDSGGAERLASLLLFALLYLCHLIWTFHDLCLHNTSVPVSPTHLPSFKLNRGSFSIP